jgi:hypothetical protein
MSKQALTAFRAARNIRNERPKIKDCPKTAAISLVLSTIVLNHNTLEHVWSAL